MLRHHHVIKLDSQCLIPRNSTELAAADAIGSRRLGKSQAALEFLRKSGKDPSRETIGPLVSQNQLDPPPVSKKQLDPL